MERFVFAVQTGLGPSEQVALKWSAIDDAFIHIELSRVRNLEKADLKTGESQRMIEIRPSMRRVLDAQRELSEDFGNPYVFLNIHGRPVLQDKAWEIWSRAMKKSGLRYRRMYETRHTFASCALAGRRIPGLDCPHLGSRGHVHGIQDLRTLYSEFDPAGWEFVRAAVADGGGITQNPRWCRGTISGTILKIARFGTSNRLFLWDF